MILNLYESEHSPTFALSSILLRQILQSVRSIKQKTPPRLACRRGGKILEKSQIHYPWPHADPLSRVFCASGITKAEMDQQCFTFFLRKI
jgi:hypothetical protein